jgi:uncharacterized membrane protein
MKNWIARPGFLIAFVTLIFVVLFLIFAPPVIFKAQHRPAEQQEEPQENR